MAVDDAVKDISIDTIRGNAVGIIGAIVVYFIIRGYQKSRGKA